MDQTNWMEVIVMAIFVISICNGYRKGFFRLCVSFVATIFTVILVSILTPHVGEAIMKWTSVDEVIEKNCMEIFAPADMFPICLTFLGISLSIFTHLSAYFL